MCSGGFGPLAAVRSRGAVLRARPLRLHERIEPDAGAAIGKGHDGGVAHGGVLADQLGQHRRVIDETAAAALAVGEVEEAARHRVVDLLAGRHPQARGEGFLREHLSLARRQRLGRVGALVLQQMPQVFVGDDAIEPAAPVEAGRELEVGHIGAAVAADQPVLLLGEIVVADAGAVQPSQRRLGRAEIGEVAMGLGQMQRDAVDEAARKSAAAGPEQCRADIEALASASACFSRAKR